MDINEGKGSEGWDRYTVPSAPPEGGGSRRRSQWSGLFEECRRDPGRWRRTVRGFGRSTAAQVASDLRNAEHRDPERMRLRGLRRGEVWEARWAPDPADPEGVRYFVWLRYMGDRTGLTVADVPPGVEEAW